MTIEISTQTTAQPSAAKRKRGFTLTEIAIVLGIIGLILGAIWGAASSVYANKKVADAEQGITASAQAVRSFFANSPSNLGATSAGQIITVPGMLPIGWTNGSNYGNPWAPSSLGTLAFVLADNTAGNTSMFAIELDGVSANGCSGLLSYFNAQAPVTAGGQVTGLIGVKNVVATAASGTAQAASAAVSNWTNGLASGCSTAAPGLTGSSGNNNIAIWFNTLNM